MPLSFLDGSDDDYFASLEKYLQMNATQCKHSDDHGSPLDTPPEEFFGIVVLKINVSDAGVNAILPPQSSVLWCNLPHVISKAIRNST